MGQVVPLSLPDDSPTGFGLDDQITAANGRVGWADTVTRRVGAAVGTVQNITVNVPNGLNLRNVSDTLTNVGPGSTAAGCDRSHRRHSLTRRRRSVPRPTSGFRVRIRNVRVAHVRCRFLGSGPNEWQPITCTAVSGGHAARHYRRVAHRARRAADDRAVRPGSSKCSSSVTPGHPILTRLEIADLIRVTVAGQPIITARIESISEQQAPRTLAVSSRSKRSVWQVRLCVPNAAG